VDTLVVADFVLKQFTKDCLNVKNLYCRADNALYYAVNGSFDGHKVVCYNNGLILKRFDFSEPQRGKDQPDRE
jgi:hypothetical protein